jgi:flagellar hook-basal body complex protein FliE
MIDRISQANIQSMIETLRSYQTQSTGINAPVNEPASNKIQGQPDFFKSVQNALDKVNDADIKADAMSEAYDRGEEVPLTEVVLSMQKSSLAFEATLQVRNKVMKAYEEIMNMPV